jgi:hypothetical protein
MTKGDDQRLEMQREALILQNWHGLKLSESRNA